MLELLWSGRKVERDADVDVAWWCFAVRHGGECAKGAVCVF